MLKVLSKLALARTYIKSHPIKKDAKNEFSKYDYFSPELVTDLVYKACIEADAICVFNLKQDALSYYSELIFTDLESGESLTTELRTDRPDIKATNITQQFGGMNTYAKRYALMSLFDIEDNSIDFDSQDNTKQEKKPAQAGTIYVKQDGAAIKGDLPWLNKGSKEYEGAITKLQAGTTTIQKIQQFYKLNKEVKANLEACTKNLIPEKSLNGKYDEYDAGDLYKQ